MFGIGSAPLWLERAAAAGNGNGANKKVLVAVFQRGAADGLNIVVPHAEKAYYAGRPSIAIPKPGDGDGACVDLDGFFGLHPSLRPLAPIFAEKKMAIIHAAGSPDPTRSHFDAQDYMESGTPGVKSTRDGWLNRVLAKESGGSPVRAVSLGPVLPRALRGSSAAVALDSVRDFRVKDPMAGEDYMARYAATVDAELKGTGKDTFAAVSMLESLRKTPYRPANGAVYPKGKLSRSLEQIAQMIKGDLGLEVAFADMGGWDHHVNETNQMKGMLGEYGDALVAFYQDLGPRMDDVAVVTMSEFGRTARENGSRGTDHGHANAMFVLGGGVQGGKVLGKWPGLEREQLYEGRDLAVTTDFREVLSTVVQSHLGQKDLSRVFPGFSDQGKMKGLYV
jgi:uncharacterized protein (DUF1501 family)